MTCRRDSIRLAATFALAVLAAGSAAAQQPTIPPPSLPTTPNTPSVQPPPPPASEAPPAAVPPPALPPDSAPAAPPALFAPGSRFNFKVDPKTPVKDLLPVPPKAQAVGGPALADDLSKVPEVEFEAQPENVTSDGKLAEHAAHQLAKIHQLNAKKSDAFMSALLESRPDLAGMPFVMGDDCRSGGDRVKCFTQAVGVVRQALGGNQGQAVMPAAQGFSPPVNTAVQPFWQQYASLCEQEDASRSRPSKELVEHVTLARIAALTQMLATESADVRLGLVKYLRSVPHAEATKALARVAIFSAEEDVRDAAVTALKVRREKDYTDILVKGLRYPWPAVAKRAAEAVAKLERADLIPELLAVLESVDPRAPKVREVKGREVEVVREVVKLNHHRNCMMCHAPAASGPSNPNVILAEVAVQGQPLSGGAQGYRQSTPELMIRLDVTYLRQDFSVLLPVAEPHTWPEMQRFDFFVRERQLSADQAAAYRAKLTPKEEGVLSPYHKAALAALRYMTGKDTAPTAEAWRKLLGQSAHAK